MGLLRLWLASVVVLGHGPAGIIRQPLFGGVLAVSAFYVISGFYIQLLICERYGSQPNWVAMFYKSRVLRIFPLYYLALIASLFLLDNHLQLQVVQSGNIRTITFMIFENLFIFGQDVGRFLFVLPGSVLSFSHPPRAGFDMASSLPLVGQAWTLALELTFYLIAPFILKRGTPVLIALTLCSLACRFTLAVVNPVYSDWHGSWWNGFPLNELATFLAGSVGYRFYRRYLVDRSIPRGVMAALLVALFAYGVLDCSQPYVYAGYVGLVVLSIPFLFRASRDLKWDRFIGELSYPVYLLHIIVWSLVSRLAISTEWAGAACIAATVLIAIPVVRLLEAPIDRFRARHFAAGGALVGSERSMPPALL